MAQFFYVCILRMLEKMFAGKASDGIDSNILGRCVMSALLSQIICVIIIIAISAIVIITDKRPQKQENKEDNANE